MMTNHEIINIVETAANAFNWKQHETGSIHETFCKVDQDPWKVCSAEFTAHFNKLEKDSMYKTNTYLTALGFEFKVSIYSCFFFSFTKNLIPNPYLIWVTATWQSSQHKWGFGILCLQTSTLRWDSGNFRETTSA